MDFKNKMLFLSQVMFPCFVVPVLSLSVPIIICFFYPCLFIFRPCAKFACFCLGLGRSVSLCVNSCFMCVMVTFASFVSTVRSCSAVFLVFSLCIISLFSLSCCPLRLCFPEFCVYLVFILVSKFHSLIYLSPTGLNIEAALAVSKLLRLIKRKNK